MPSASPSSAGECWPAVKMPSTSVTLSPASRTALVIASRWSVSWLFPGRLPISSLSSAPTMQTELESGFRSATGVTAPARGAREEGAVAARLAAGREEPPLPEAVGEGPGLGRDGTGQGAIEFHAFLSLGGRDARPPG